MTEIPDCIQAAEHVARNVDGITITELRSQVEEHTGYIVSTGAWSRWRNGHHPVPASVVRWINQRNAVALTQILDDFALAYAMSPPASR